MTPTKMNTIRLGVLPTHNEPLRERAIPTTATGAPGRILVVPGRDVTARWLAVSGATPAQQRAAALAAMTPSLGASPDSVIVALGPIQDGRAMVCIASRDRAAEWLAAARAQGFAPTAIIPDFALVIPPIAGEVKAARRKDSWVMRGEDIAFDCPDALAELLVGGRKAVETDFDTELAAFIQGGRLATAPDFSRALAASAQTPRPGFPVRRLAILATAALALAIAAPWVKAVRSDAAAAAMRREAVEIARAALPEASRIVDPGAQLRAELAPWQNDRLLYALLSHTLDGVAAAPGATLQRIEADPASGLSARLSVTKADDLAPLRTRLATARLAATETFGADQGGLQDVDILVRPAT